MSTERIQLFKKIGRVMKAIPELAKTGSMSENGEESYKYHEADAIRRRFRKELLKQKLLCLPTSVEETNWRNPTSTGGNFNYSSQKITFSFIDSETGEQFDCQAVGWGGDALDRAAPKAAIQALKYFLVNGFFVEGIELDGDSAEEKIKGREDNRQHQWFEGVPDTMYADKELAWLMIDGNRLFAVAPKLRKQIKMLHEGANGKSEQYCRMKVRTYMGMLSGDGVNPHCLIDKIEVMEVPNGKTA